MRPVSDAWLRTVIGSWTPITRITLCETFQTGSSPVGERLELAGGSVTLDGSADIYTVARLSFPGALWDSLRPNGREVYVQTGIRYSDSLVELVGLGYLRVRLPSQSDAQEGGIITVDAEDRDYTLNRADLLRPRVFPAATTYGTMAYELVTEVFPGATITWDDDTDTLPIGRDITVEQYRLEALQAIARATGKLRRWNGNGEMAFTTARSLFEPLRHPVARLAGGHGGVLATVAREINDDVAVNAWVVRGDGADDVGSAYGAAIDNDPHSEIRYGGRFGPAPLIESNSLVTTDAQANQVAQLYRSRGSGLAHTLRWTGSPRPELEPDDMVEIQHANGIAWHLINQLEIPLLPGGTQTGTSRAQAVGA